MFNVIFSLFIYFTVFSTSAYAEKSSGARWNYTSIALDVAGAEVELHSDFNMGLIAGLGIYGAMVGTRENYVSEQRVKEDQWSFESYGWEVGLQVSRFSNPFLMSGFFWSLGGGYRSLQAEWFRPMEAGYVLNDTDEVDEEYRLQRNYRQFGGTGHGKLGYRYASIDHSFSIGGYAGIKHFSNTIEGKELVDQEAMSDDQREELQRLATTRPILALELGIAL